MLGVPILINMKQTEANLWDGKIYDATRGSIWTRTSASAVSDMLEVRGCVGGFFCGGEDWKRVTGTTTPPLAQPAHRPRRPPAPQAKGRRDGAADDRRLGQRASDSSAR